HSRTVSSPEPEAMSRPSGEKATAVTDQPEWPLRTRRSAPVAASHSRTVSSSEPEAMSRPSGEKATAVTDHEWPLRTRRSAPVADIGTNGRNQSTPSLLQHYISSQLSCHICELEFEWANLEDAS